MFCFFLVLPLRLRAVSVVFDFNASLNDVAPLSPMLFPVVLITIEESGLLMDVIYVLFLLSSQLRLNCVNVLLIFSVSLNVFAPASQMLLSVGLTRTEEWIVDGCHLCVVSLSSRLRVSFVIVVFDFNASLSGIAPVSPMSFPVDNIQHKSVKHPLV